MTLYFDSAATSFPKPSVVTDAITQCLKTQIGNPGRSAGGSVNRELFRVRESLAAFFGVSNSSRIVFTLNATAAINLALFGILKANDRVITTSMEHNAVVRPLAHLRQTRHIEIDVLQASPEGYVDPDDLKRALRKPARMVVMNHASNICGAWNELAEFGCIIRNQGVLFMVDASQSAGVIPIDVEKDCIDILACAGHKNLLGPSGTGLCYFHPNLVVEPLLYGGTGSESDHETMPDALPDRFEAGTLNFHGLIGLGAAIRYLMNMGSAEVFQTELAVARHMHDRLCHVEGLTICGPRYTGTQLPVFSVICPGFDPADLGSRLDEEFEIITRTGLHCAPWAHRTIQTYPLGSVRISGNFMTKKQDIDTLGNALELTVRKIRS